MSKAPESMNKLYPLNMNDDTKTFAFDMKQKKLN